MLNLLKLEKIHLILRKKTIIYDINIKYLLKLKGKKCQIGNIN